VSKSKFIRQHELALLRMLPRHTYASDELTNGVYREYKDHAVERRYIGLNGEKFTNYITLDGDRGNPSDWIDANLPYPLYTAANPDDTRYHVTWQLAYSVCRTENARAKPLAYLAAIQRTLPVVLGTDPLYTGLVTKNPLHGHWRVTWWGGRPVTLGELARVCEPLLSRRIGENNTPEDGSLNPMLFNHLRRWAYRERRHFNDFATWCVAVLMQACHYNAEGTRLPYAEVENTAKSVSRWVWNHYQGGGDHRNRGALQLPPDLKISERQRLGALYTAGLKTESTRQRLQQGVSNLLIKGVVDLTPKQLEAETGVPLRTVQRYWSSIISK
jgi:hypothetical protein